jgi:hypothetical protein
VPVGGAPRKTPRTLRTAAACWDGRTRTSAGVRRIWNCAQLQATARASPAPQKTCGQMRCSARIAASAATITGMSVVLSGRTIARLYTSAADAPRGCDAL